jgi:hypothetical protein
LSLLTRKDLKCRLLSSMIRLITTKMSFKRTKCTYLRMVKWTWLTLNTLASRMTTP